MERLGALVVGLLCSTDVGGHEQKVDESPKLLPV